MTVTATAPGSNGEAPLRERSPNRQLDHVNIVFVGPCGSGKSTAAGRLIADLVRDQSTAAVLERIAKEAEVPDHALVDAAALVRGQLGGEAGDARDLAEALRRKSQRSEGQGLRAVLQEHGWAAAGFGTPEQQQLEALLEDLNQADVCGRRSRRYAWILDKLRCERQRGGSMYVGLWKVVTDSCRFTVIDTPGHDEFSREVITAMSQADVAVLVVSASDAAAEGADDQPCAGFARQHSFLARMLRVRHVVVCINKVDDLGGLSGYLEADFLRAKDVISEDLRSAGHEPDSVHCIPTSGIDGTNLVGRNDRTPWYEGPTLLEALHAMHAHNITMETVADRPLRIPLREVMQIGGSGVVALGQVETGKLRPLNTDRPQSPPRYPTLIFQPGGVCVQVSCIESHRETILEASPGDAAALHVNVPMKQLSRGMVGSVIDDDPAMECSHFLAHIIVLNAPRAGEIRSRCALTLDCHTAQVPCIVEELFSRMDCRTGKILESNPDAILVGDVAVVRISPQDKICIEAFDRFPALGRFLVRDQKTTVALGIVQEVEHVDSPLVRQPAEDVTGEHAGPVPAKARHRALGQERRHSSTGQERSNRSTGQERSLHAPRTDVGVGVGDMFAAPFPREKSGVTPGQASTGTNTAGPFSIFAASGKGLAQASPFNAFASKGSGDSGGDDTDPCAKGRGPGRGVVAESGGRGGRRGGRNVTSQDPADTESS